MAEFVFLVEWDDGRCVALRNTGPQPPAEARVIVGETLWPVEDQPGMWGTGDGHTTVTRYEPKPVGTFPEDYAGAGVPVAVTR